MAKFNLELEISDSFIQSTLKVEIKQIVKDNLKLIIENKIKGRSEPINGLIESAIREEVKQQMKSNHMIKLEVNKRVSGISNEEIINALTGKDLDSRIDKQLKAIVAKVISI